MQRALCAEIATAAHLESIGLHWDMDTLFDSILMHKLISLALDAKIPAILLQLALVMHMRPRRFKEGRAMGPFVLPKGRSIIAGCKTRIDITRCLFYNTIANFRRQCRPMSLNHKG